MPAGTKLQRAWEKWSFVAALQLSRADVGQLKDRAGQAWRRKLGMTNASDVQGYLAALKVIETAIPELGEANAVQSAALFADVSAAALANVGDELVRLRGNQAAASIEGVNSIAEQFECQTVASTSSTQHRPPLPSDCRV